MSIWRDNVSVQHRHSVVQWIFVSMCPFVSPELLQEDERVKRVFKYAQSVEQEFYQYRARSRNHYYILVRDKISKLMRHINILARRKMKMSKIKLDKRPPREHDVTAENLKQHVSCKVYRTEERCASVVTRANAIRDASSASRCNDEQDSIMYLDTVITVSRQSVS